MGARTAVWRGSPHPPPPTAQHPGEAISSSGKQEVNHGLRRPAGHLAPRVRLMSAWTEGPSLSPGKQEGGLEEKIGGETLSPARQTACGAPTEGDEVSTDLATQSIVWLHLGLAGGTGAVTCPNLPTQLTPSPSGWAYTYLTHSRHEHGVSLAPFYRRPKRSRSWPRPRRQRVAQDFNSALCDYGALLG